MRTIILGISLAILLVWALMSSLIKSSENKYNERLGSKINECFDTHLVSYSTTQLSVMGQSSLSKTILKGQLYSRHWYEDEVEYSLFMANNMTFSPQQDSSLLQVFDQSFMAKRDDSGFFTSLYFSNKTSDSDEKLLSGLILPFQSSVTLGAHTTYDSLGTYKAEFTKEKELFIKSKSLYSKNNTFGASIGTNIQVADNNAAYQFDECWLKTFKGRESLNIETITTEQSMLLLAVNFELTPYLIEDNPLEKFRGLAASDILREFNLGDKSDLSYQDIAIAESNTRRIEDLNLTTEDLIGVVVSSNASIADYALYLRTHSEQLSEIINKVLSGETTPRQTMFLTELLAHVGNNSAQQALIDISYADNLSLNSRIQAIAAFTSLQFPPTDAVLSALMLYHASLDSDEMRELATTASLALGALAGKFADKEPDLHDEIIELMTNGLASSTTPQSKRAQLIALTNASPKGLSSRPFTRFLTNEHSSVRRASIALLSKIATDDTIQTLLNFEKNEVDVTVRTEVFKRLSQVRLSSRHLELVVKASLLETSPSVRSYMIQLLGQHIDDNPQLVKSLKKLKRQETNEDNILQITKQLMRSKDK